MFNITLQDHLRLTFAHVARSQHEHAERADRLSGRVRQIRIAVVLLLSGSVASSVAAVLYGSDRSGVLAAGLAGAALLVYIASLALNLEPRIHAHRSSAARLWLYRERYRALLSDLYEGAITLEAARARRDALMQELHDAHEQSPLGHDPAGAEPEAPAPAAVEDPPPPPGSSAGAPTAGAAG